MEKDRCAGWLLVAALHDNPVCVFSQLVSESGERDIHRYTDANKHGERARVTKTASLTKTEPTMLRQNRLFLTGQNVGINGQKLGDTTLQFSLLPWLKCKLFSQQQQRIQQEATTSLRHVSQQHSLWTVADDYSNCHRNKIYDSNKIKVVCVLLDIYAFKCKMFLHSGVSETWEACWMRRNSDVVDTCRWLIKVYIVHFCKCESNLSSVQSCMETNTMFLLFCALWISLLSRGFATTSWW